MAEDIRVSVDKDFARFGSKGYAINKINSVDVTFRHPYGRGIPFACGLLAIVFLLAAIGGGGTGQLLIAGILAGLAWWTWRLAKVREYQLMLATSSGSVQAVKSRDEAFIMDTRQRLERAIAGTLER